jgi:uncharacterized protein involved in exopolysaccharide biosynthesis
VDNPQALPSDEVDAIDFAAALRLLWRYRWWVAATSILCGLVALVIALTSQPYFRAETALIYVHDKGMGNGPGELATELGGLASLAGMNLLTGGTEDQDALAVLDSHRLAEVFIQRNDLVPVLLRKSKKPPTMWRAVKLFKEGTLAIHKDPRKGVTSIVVTWKDPQTAAKWANAYAELANELIRKHMIDESSRNITYLNEQIARTNDVDLRKVLYNILESQTKTLMLANAREDYAFQIVDPAVPPELKAGPHGSLFLLVGLMLGLCLGGGIAFAHDRIVRHRRARAEFTGGVLPVAQG